MTVGERIKKRREELGMTQDDLAQRLGLKGRSAVCKAESSGNSITTNSLTRYAKALGVTEAYLLDWDEEMTEGYTQGIMDAKLLSKYHQLNEEHQKMVLRQIDLLLDMEQ